MFWSHNSSHKVLITLLSVCGQTLNGIIIADKELLNEKERQDIELQAQRLTLQEQRNHIDILDSALMSAQNNVVKLETEVDFNLSSFESLQKFLMNVLSVIVSKKAGIWGKGGTSTESLE